MKNISRDCLYLGLIILFIIIFYRQVAAAVINYYDKNDNKKWWGEDMGDKGIAGWIIVAIIAVFLLYKVIVNWWRKY
jgi:hypothetical protein